MATTKTTPKTKHKNLDPKLMKDRKPGFRLRQVERVPPTQDGRIQLMAPDPTVVWGIMADRMPSDAADGLVECYKFPAEPDETGFPTKDAARIMAFAAFAGITTPEMGEDENKDGTVEVYQVPDHLLDAAKAFYEHHASHAYAVKELETAAKAIKNLEPGDLPKAMRDLEDDEGEIGWQLEQRARSLRDMAHPKFKDFGFDRDAIAECKKRLLTWSDFLLDYGVKHLKGGA